jgi:hypothetical protein
MIRANRILLALSGAILFSGSALLAQSASLQGTVRDPQGAVVPGADVTVTNKATQAVRSGISDDTGRYVFQQLTPGAYSVRCELPGFKTFEIDEFRLLVDTNNTLDILLEVGAPSEVVTVASDQLLLNRTDATIGNAFNELQIQELPLESRNVVDLLSLQPGVTRGGEVAGARSDQSNLTLDGIDVNEQQEGTAFSPVLRVTPDSVQEFRVTTTNPNASQGRSSGAQVSLITRSGTNEFHGAVYEYHRNTVTTANNFFNNRSGVERPALIRNLYGGRLGGPIVKDRVFFFFNYEGRKDRKQESVVRFVPLPHLGLGQVKYENINGQIVTLTQDDLNAIYPVGVNPLAIKVLGEAAARYPANDNSEGDGLNTGGYRFNSPLPLDWNTYTARLDFNLSEKHQLYLRGNYQWDNELFVGQYPDTPAPAFWNHPLGLAASHTWTASPTFVNTFRYGLTRQGFSEQGDSAENSIGFRFVYWPRLFTRTLSRATPVHNFTDDLSWIKGEHTWQFGINFRTVRNERASLANTFDDAVTNPSFYDLSGAVVSNPIADLHPGSVSVLQNAATAVIGRYSQYSGNYNFNSSGSLLPPGTFNERNFATEEYEFYGQDTWRIRDNFTLTYGLRWSTSRPVYEQNGYQVKPDFPLGEYFNLRKASAAQGVPFNEIITVDTAGPYYGKGGWYKQDWSAFSPRIAFAFSPRFEDGLLAKIFGGPNKSVIRGGWATLYDRIGSRLAVSFDLSNPLGFSSSETIAANTYNVTDRPAPLFTGFDQDIRSLPGLHVPGSLVFPLVTPPDEAQRIEASLDDTLDTPVNHAWNLSWGRELPYGLFFEASYVGRAGRDLMAQRDVMALNNLVDPVSGLDWYTAARALAAFRSANVPVDQVPEVPYFTNLFPTIYDYAGNWCGFDSAGYTPTQQVYSLVAREGCDILDWTFIQLLIDDEGLVPNLFFHPQYAALSVWSTVAYSNYHAGQFTLRERFRDVLVFDINYTFAKSMDNASGAQTTDFYDTAGFIINPLRPDDFYAESDFDIRHIVNANWLWHMPFGRGRTYGADWSGFADALLGGWQLHGIFRWNTGLPEVNPFDRAQWATNWNVQSNAVRVRDPRANPSKKGDRPNMWEDPVYAYQSYRNALPGESGDRNVLRRQGFFAMDLGLNKTFRMPYAEGHSLEFRWEVFNVTNTQRLGGVVLSRNSLGIGQDPDLGAPPPTFGNIASIQGSPRVMQFALRYEF